MDIGVAVDHPPRDLRARVGTGLGGGADADHRPADKDRVEDEPDQQRDHEARIRIEEQQGSPHQVGQRKGDRVEDLENGVPRGGRRLHDPVGQPSGKVVLEPAHGLAQHMAMRAPADQRAEIDDDRIVQKGHVQPLDDWPDQQDEDGDGQQFPAVFRQHGVRAEAAQNIDQAAHIGDQPQLQCRHHDRHERGERKDLLERLRIGPEKRADLARGLILFRVVGERIDHIFEETKHGGGRILGFRRKI